MVIPKIEMQDDILEDDWRFNLSIGFKRAKDRTSEKIKKTHGVEGRRLLA